MKQTSANPELEVVYGPTPTLEGTVDSASAGVTERLRLLWEHRALLFRFAAYGLVLATVIAFLIPKRYESTTRLMPPDDQSNSAFAMAAALGGKLPGGLGAMAGDVLGLKSTGALFIGILTSRTVQDDLVNKFDLRKVYSARTWEQARLALAEKTGISEDHKSGIITITVSDSDPQRATAMAEEYAVELNKVVNQLSTSSARRERVFLEERLTQVEHDLETAEKEFGDFASKNTAVDIDEQAKAMLGAAATLQGELIATQSQLEGLKKIYTENNVRVRSLRARVTELQSQLNKMGGKYDSVSDPGDNENDSLYPSIRKLPVLGVAFADLYRRTKMQATVFEILTEQYELAKVAEAKETPNVKVLDPSSVPEHKSFPPRLIIMVLGTVFGFATAVVWVVGRHRWERIDPEAPHKILAQEVFASLNASMPWATPNGSRLQSATHKLWCRLAPQNGVENHDQPSKDRNSTRNAPRE